jgi:hypothetical protein
MERGCRWRNLDSYAMFNGEPDFHEFMAALGEKAKS